MCLLQMMLITDYCEGGNLSTRIHKSNSEPRMAIWHRDGKGIALGVARALVYLHSRDVIWFDCKPSNVLLDGTGKLARIADVGISKVLTGSKTETLQV